MVLMVEGALVGQVQNGLYSQWLKFYCINRILTTWEADIWDLFPFLKMLTHLCLIRGLELECMCVCVFNAIPSSFHGQAEMFIFLL